MNKETTDNMDEDFNIEELLGEDEDSPVNEVAEEPSIKSEKKSKRKPKGVVSKKETPEVPAEIAEAEKDLSDMEWQFISQEAYDGYQNIKTGEIINDREAIRRTLCYAQEAARNSR